MSSDSEGDTLVSNQRNDRNISNNAEYLEFQENFFIILKLTKDFQSAWNLATFFILSSRKGQ